jgi:hypothetical protein
LELHEVLKIYKPIRIPLILWLDYGLATESYIPFFGAAMSLGAACTFLFDWTGLIRYNNDSKDRALIVFGLGVGLVAIGNMLNK